MTRFASYHQTLAGVEPMLVTGRVVELRGLTVLACGLTLPIGSLVSIGSTRVLGEIVGFTAEHAIVMLLGQTGGIRAGDAIVGEQVTQSVQVGEGLLGRVIDGLGRVIDDGPTPEGLEPRPLTPEPISALRRSPISQPLRTGVRAIDLMTTLGRGQRMGLFAGPGVGKSTLLASIARGTSADITVIALIGERGREVREFIEETLDEATRQRSIVVAATGDESPLMRLRAAKVACAAAEHFRDRGLDVLLMMDSVTRFAHAQRQVGLSVGEPPTTRGYTPSVFAQLALLLERAGAVEREGGTPGSITGLYTVLVEGDDMTEPIADAARGILDGHLMLSRKLAQRAHYPAIDVLDSVSRVARQVSSPEHIAGREMLISLLAAYRDVEDLVQIGAYARGANAAADRAIAFEPRINGLLRQSSHDSAGFEESIGQMCELVAEIRAFEPGGARESDR
ncbi:MAG: FliI/YscN family ATPase [Phycisphaerales bacterium JB037]